MRIKSSLVMEIQLPSYLGDYRGSGRFKYREYREEGKYTRYFFRESDLIFLLIFSRMTKVRKTSEVTRALQAVPLVPSFPPNRSLTYILIFFTFAAFNLTLSLYAMLIKSDYRCRFFLLVYSITLV